MIEVDGNGNIKGGDLSLDGLLGASLQSEYQSATSLMLGLLWASELTILATYLDRMSIYA